MSSTMTAVVLGVHCLDTLVRPVDVLPEGQGGQLVDEIKMTAAGTAGGTALVLARLGATVFSAGAIGDDAIGDQLLVLLGKEGVNTDNLLRRPQTATSASVLPIRSDGSRPAFHVIGANASYGSEDAPFALIEQATHLHLGGPEFMGGEAAATILSFARDRGVTTSVDCLGPGEPWVLEVIAPALAHVDFLLPNDEQALGWTSTDTLEEACTALLSLGAGCVAVTAGAEGAMVATGDDFFSVPAFPITPVDTSGCGDAFSAGFLRGLALGLDTRESARLGCATAAQVASGLGTDAGSYDLASVQAFASSGGQL